MRNTLTLILLLSLSTVANADDRVDRFLEIMEASLNTTTLFYSRISPEVAAMIKPVTLPPEAKDVANCVVSKAKSDGLTAELDESLVLGEAFRQYILDTPSLTLLTIEKDEQFQKLQEQMLAPRFKGLQDHSKECGVIEMNIKLSAETGVYEAMKQIRQ